jgi:hypothetical protein
MTYVITMGQAFRGDLEAAVKAMGARHIRGRFADGSTSWRVIAIFPRGVRQRDVTQTLWARWPSAQVAVKRAGPAEINYFI